MSHAADQYVAEALLLGGFDLGDLASQRVAVEFGRIAAIAATLDEPQLGLHDEPLPVDRA